MDVAPGTRVGSYEIMSLLGRGGMGEVWKARDTKLGREVALKLLPADFIADRDRVARFEREAQTLASLSHPHIAAIHGVEDADGVAALVLELAEGPTLAERLAHGAMPLNETLPIAKQIVEALEAAHGSGIIHRDLKPANIVLQNAGRFRRGMALDDVSVKVLDFGLAKTLEAGDGEQPNASRSPTITSPTRVGVVLGTAAYMAPEQARGRAIDRRVDVWAFGCLLYEMLTGRQAFGGEDVAEIIGAVIHKDPDWTALPADTPPAIRTLLRRCLQKNRQQRIPDIGIARIEIEDAISGGSPDVSLPAPASRQNRERLAWLVATVAATMAAVFATMWWFRASPTDTRVYTTSLLPVEEAPLVGLPPGRFSISPDGRYIAFTAGGTGAPSLWLRSLERGTVRRLTGTEVTSGQQFWSPNSRFLAFVAQGQLMKIDIAGGPPTILSPATNGGTAGSWSKNGVIVFTAKPNEGLHQIPAEGGVATPATTLDTAAGDNRHWWPYFLPDGKHFLYEAVGSAASQDDPRAVYIGSLDPAEKSRLLLNGGSNAKYAQGYVLFMRERTLMAQPFDVKGLVLTGEPRAVAEHIDVGGSTGQSGAFSVSESGTLVYQTATDEPGTQLRWFDRAGKEIGVVGTRARHGDLQLSPDATRAVVSLPRSPLQTTRRDIWIVDLQRGVRSRFTPDERDEFEAVWSPDGSRVAFNAGRRGPSSAMNLYAKSSSGGSEEPLLEDSTNKSPLSWSHNGQFLLYATGPRDANLWVLPLKGDRKPIPYMQTPFTENGGRFSPDDRWVAYGSNESGQNEIYVAPFPETGAKSLVSTAGAVIGSARWRADGRELFYLARRDVMLMAVEIDTRGLQINVSRITPLFRLSIAPGQGSPYDVSPDGQRFLVNTVVENRASEPLSLVINWTATLTKD